MVYGNPETTTGGNALKFYCSVRLDIQRKKPNKRGDETVGHECKVKVVKNKCAPPFREAEFEILFGTGINKLGELVDTGEKLDLLEKSGTWYSYRGVWGSSASDVYAVGDAGALLRFDGTSWMATGPTLGVDLLDIAGTGPNDIFVIGTAGSIFHYDGVAWTAVRPVSNNMPTAVAVRNDMVLIGEDSNDTSLSILVRSGASW